MADKDNKQKDTETRIKLPSIRKAARRDRDVARAQANHKEMWEFFGLVFTILLLLFVLWGGVNQVAFFKTIGDMTNRVGEAIYSMFVKDATLDVTETGIHLTNQNESGQNESGQE